MYLSTLGFFLLCLRAFFPLASLFYIVDLSLVRAFHFLIHEFDTLSGLRSDNIYDSSLTVVLAGLLAGKPAHVANTLLARPGQIW